MKHGYKIEYDLLFKGVKVIECCNFIGLNMVKFYQWEDRIYGTMDNTVAIFKINPKSK